VQVAGVCVSGAGGANGKRRVSGVAREEERGIVSRAVFG